MVDIKLKESKNKGCKRAQYLKKSSKKTIKKSYSTYFYFLKVFSKFFKLTFRLKFGETLKQIFPVLKNVAYEFILLSLKAKLLPYSLQSKFNVTTILGSFFAFFFKVTKNCKRELCVICEVEKIKPKITEYETKSCFSYIISKMKSYLYLMYCNVTNVK